MARMGKRRGVYRMRVGKSERDHLENLSVDGRIKMDLQEIE